MITDQDAKEVLATNLRRLLEQRGISQRQLALKTGDPVMTISNIVNGKNLAGSGIVARIAEAMEVDIDSLFTARRKNSRRSA